MKPITEMIAAGAAFLLTVALIAMVAHGAIQEFDRWGDEQCANGRFTDPAACPND